MQGKILDIIKRHASIEGAQETGIEGLNLFRVTKPIQRIPAVYSPSICVILQGCKYAYLNGERLVYDKAGYLCCTMPTPVEVEVPYATSEKPIYGFILNLNQHMLTELLLEFEAFAEVRREAKHIIPASGLKVISWDEHFSLDALRLLSLLDDPIQMKILGKGRIRELIFTLIRGEAGPLLMRNTRENRDLVRVLNYIQDNFNTSIAIDDLVKRVGMSKPVFHRKFKAATTLSPLQFIKALRLNEAAMMISRGIKVEQAAYQVGYESSSQFSREFRRYFGDSPSGWRKRFD